MYVIRHVVTFVSKIHHRSVQYSYTIHVAEKTCVELRPIFVTFAFENYLRRVKLSTPNI